MIKTKLDDIKKNMYVLHISMNKKLFSYDVYSA